jgi:serine protease Do
VNIYATSRVKQQLNPMFDDPFVKRFFGGNVPGGQMATRVQNSLGSGVIVRSDGIIVTNAHVIHNADEIRVALNDKREFPAKVVLKDEHADLAVLRIDTGGEKLPVLELEDSDTAQVGDLVLAIGNPFGVGQTVTNGIISAIGRSAEGISEFNEFIQTDAPINPGNSGGALLSMNGKVWGINAAIYSRDGGSLGIGFAIPANAVRVFVDAAENGTRPLHPWIGVNGQSVTSEIAASLGMKRPTGLLIDNVTADGPAAKAGIKQGDVLMTLADRDISDTPSLRARLGTMKPDTAVPVTVFRDGQLVTLTITPIAAPEIPKRDMTKLTGHEPLAGATIENLSPAVTEELGLVNQGSGVIVSSVIEGSNAANIGIQVGDMILAVNTIKVDSVITLAKIIGAREQAQQQPQQWKMTLRRGDQILNFTLQG